MSEFAPSTASAMGLPAEVHEYCRGITTWLDPPEAVVGALLAGSISESELLDGCRCLVAIASVNSPSAFDQLLKAVSRWVETLSLLASLTREVIRAREQNGKEEDTWAAEALDTLLDTWTVLFQPEILGREYHFPPAVPTQWLPFLKLMLIPK